MKGIIFLVALIVMSYCGWSQITITASDMPVSGDMLRYSFSSPTGSAISPADSGTGVAWSYSLTPIRQSVDTFKSAAAVNLLYAVTIGSSAYGYKVADSLPGTPVAIKQLYTFFETKTSPSRYEAVSFAANIGGLPTAANYSSPDVWYYFPLAYGNNDSTDYSLNFSLATVGGMKQSGYRKSRVDGWGTITTPYYTSPVSCIRVRSEIHEIDSITFSSTTFGFPRNSVEYKWLVNGAHYPALWVTSTVTGGTETITSIKYTDSVRSFTPPINGVTTLGQSTNYINAYPNPSISGLVQLELPADWKTFDVELFDVQSRVIATCKNERQINMGGLPAGPYFVRVTCGDKTAFARIVR